MRTGRDTPQPTTPHPTTFGIPPSSPVLELLETGRSSPVLMSVLLSLLPYVRRLRRGSHGGVWKTQLSSCGAISQSSVGSAGRAGGLQPWRPPRRPSSPTDPPEHPTWAGEHEASRAGASHGDDRGSRAAMAVPAVPVVLPLPEPPQRPPQHPQQSPRLRPRLRLSLRQQRLDLVSELVVVGKDRDPSARRSDARAHGGTAL